MSTARSGAWLPTPSDHPQHGWQPYSDMHNERIRAHAKHADKPGGSMEQKGYDDPDWLPVLTEELGEVARELCEARHGNRPEEVERVSVLISELVQLGAMTAAWIDACGERLADLAAEDAL